MTIANALTALNTDIQNARAAITNKGGTITANGGSSQLATDITTIPSGGSKYGANINTLLGDVDANGVLQQPTEQSQLVFTGVQEVAQNGLYNTFYRNPSITSVNFPALATLSNQCALENSFEYCTNLTNIYFPELTQISANYGLYATLGYTKITTLEFPKLTTINGNNSCAYMCNHCTSLTTVEFPKLTTLGGSYGLYHTFEDCTALTSVSFPQLTTTSGTHCLLNIFSRCTALTSISFPNLTTLNGNINGGFYNCTSLVTQHFPKLTTIATTAFSSAFSGCKEIKDIYFNKVTTSTFATVKNQFNNMFDSSTALTSGTVNIHFPSNLSSTVSGLTGYPTFGGNSSRVVLKFDLSATS